MKKSTREILGNYGIVIKEETTNDYKTLCPFHNDNSPSFSIRKDNGVYHCWSCGAKGNLITFVKNLEHLTYEEAKQKVYGKDELSVFVDFENTFIKKKSIRKLNIDLKYYEFKYLIELLFYRDERNLQLRKKLSILKNEDEFQYILNRQRNLKDKKSNRKFINRIATLELVFKTVEEHDAKKYCSKEYEDTKYEMLMSMLKSYNFENEIAIILDLQNSEEYRKLYKIKKLKFDKEKINQLVDGIFNDNGAS